VPLTGGQGDHNRLPGTFGDEVEFAAPAPATAP
jgi:hypothetical protein